MACAILAAFNTNSRCLIGIWRSWGLVGAKKRKQGAAQVVPGVRQICKNMKIGKKWVGSGRECEKVGKSGSSECDNREMAWEWSGELQTGAKRSAQLSERF